jgi:hypothetical protein
LADPSSFQVERIDSNNNQRRIQRPVDNNGIDQTIGLVLDPGINHTACAFVRKVKLTIIAELAEPSSQEVEEHRRRYQELERILGTMAVKATAIVENGGGDDDDQNTASSPFDRKGNISLIGTAYPIVCPTIIYIPWSQ